MVALLGRTVGAVWHAGGSAGRVAELSARETGAARHSPLRGAQTLLADQQEDGGFGLHTYQKFGGAHWRLLRLAELQYPPAEKSVLRAIESALPWILSFPGELVAGRWRRCASQQGAAVYYCVHLGVGTDPRVRTLVDRLLVWQWPDGGWNCDTRPGADHSSFHESLWPVRGLMAYSQLTGDEAAKAAAEATVELLLRHHLFRHDHGPDRSIIDREFAKLHSPYYWHYNVLDGCRAVAATGKLNDPRAAEALDLVESKRRPDGTWAPERVHWRQHENKKLTRTEVVSWAKVGEPDTFLTLNALRVLKAAGRV